MPKATPTTTPHLDGVNTELTEMTNEGRKKDDLLSTAPIRDPVAKLEQKAVHSNDLEIVFKEFGADGLFKTTPIRSDAANPTRARLEIKVFLKEIKKDDGEQEFSDEQVRQLVELLKKQRITTMQQLKKLSQGEMERCGIPGGAAKKLQKALSPVPSPPDLSTVNFSRELVQARMSHKEMLGFLTTGDKGRDPIDFFKGTVLKQHGIGFGKMVDQSQLPIMVTSGQSGFGKTEFLLQVSERFDTVTTVPSVGKPIGCIPQEFIPYFSQVVVAMASFNQGTTYRPTDERGIVQRCIDRWVKDLGWTKDLRITLGQKTIQDFTEEVRRVVSRTTGETNHKKIAVFLLVDDVHPTRITDEQNRKTLLTSLGAAMQQDLEDSRPTFSVVTSLDLWDVADTYVIDSQRRVAALPLPALHTTEHQKEKILEFLGRPGQIYKRSDDIVAWNRIVQLITLSTNGRPRSIDEAYEALEEKVPQEDVGKIEPVQLIKNSWRKASRIWDEVFAQQLLGEELPSLTAKEHNQKRKTDPEWNDLFADDFLFATPKPIVSITADDFKVTLEASPLHFLNVASRFSSDSPPPDYRGSSCPFKEVLPWDLINSLFRIIKETDPDKTAKEWETGIVGLVVLRALAWEKVKKTEPTLEELLPYAVMPKEVKDYKINLTPSCGLREVDTKNGAQLWPKTADEKNVFHLSLKTNEEGIEGALELRTSKGTRCAGLTQNKLKTAMGPTDIGKAADNALDRKWNADDCAILFATGEPNGFEVAMKDYLAGKKVVLVGTKCLQVMLKPIGGNCFLSIVDAKTGVMMTSK